MLEYSTKLKDNKLDKSAHRSKSLKTFTSAGGASTVIFDAKNSFEKKRTDALIRMLRDKGLKVTSNNEEEGMTAFEHHK